MSKKYWVQFLNHPLMAPGYCTPDETRVVDACGDRAVFILDGRNNIETMRSDALKRAQWMQHCTKFAAFQIVVGRTFCDEISRGPVVKLSYPVQVLDLQMQV